MLMFSLFLAADPPEDKEARLQRLMETYGNDVLRVCFLYLKDHALAQDAAQTTFLKAWQALHTLRDGTTEKAWLLRIAVNTCKTMLKSREYQLYAHNPDMERLPEPFAEDKPRDNTVLSAVHQLPEHYQEAVILHYYQGLSTADMARILRLPQSTVLTRLRRARKLLENLLKGWYFDHE